MHIYAYMYMYVYCISVHKWIHEQIKHQIDDNINRTNTCTCIWMYICIHVYLYMYTNRHTLLGVVSLWLRRWKSPPPSCAGAWRGPEGASLGQCDERGGFHGRSLSPTEPWKVCRFPRFFFQQIGEGQSHINIFVCCSEFDVIQPFPMGRGSLG